jgi:tRNA(adenine34) deaminase
MDLNETGGEAKMGPYSMKNQHNDAAFMFRALVEAGKAAGRGEVPVGAVVVRDGKIVGRGGNRPILNRDPTAHAEIVALRNAGRRLKDYRLPDCDLFVTLEPCAMCLGAIVQARIRRLVYGASDPKSGAVSSIMRFPFKKLNHHPRVVPGVMAAESSRLLRDFFRNKRRRADRSIQPE